jgi:hypothetical protein
MVKINFIKVTDSDKESKMASNVITEGVSYVFMRRYNEALKLAKSLESIGNGGKKVNIFIFTPESYPPSNDSDDVISVINIASSSKVNIPESSVVIFINQVENEDLVLYSGSQSYWDSGKNKVSVDESIGTGTESIYSLAHLTDKFIGINIPEFDVYVS